MKLKRSPNKCGQRDLFRTELSKIIDRGHSLVKLSKVVDWDRMDEFFGRTFCPDNGRPAVSTRLMVSLHYLKYTHNLSDDDVVSAWVENPYWQYLSGMKFFEHELPIHPSSMSRWRTRIGEAGSEELLKKTIVAGLKLKAVKPYQLKRVNVDTTCRKRMFDFLPMHGFMTGQRSAWWMVQKGMVLSFGKTTTANPGTCWPPTKPLCSCPSDETC